MFELMNDYVNFYQRYLQDRWNDVGPQQYVMLLLSVGAIGWYMMRKASTST